jgi:thioester reductase-like protein
MRTIFVTGFPGLLASDLVGRLFDSESSTRIVCLVQSRFLHIAHARRSRLDAIYRHRLHFVEGDITHADLGIDRGLLTYDEIEEIFHFAAVYSLSVDRATAHSVNADGTRHVMDFAHACRNLQRMHYVSTCYVSGTFAGTFTENDLVNGQSFHNHYEESKYRAELEVQAAMRSGMPVTIYRPSIVVGDSRDGSTQKFDGPYPLIRWMLRMPSVSVLPVVGRPSKHAVNFVPRDFVAEALFTLSRMSRSEGQVYHLSDPNEMTVADSIDILGRATARRVLRVPMPQSVARGLIRQISRLDGSLGLDPTMIDYFQHPGRYTCENTLRDLEGTGIQCPPFSAYADRMVDFVRANPKIPFAGMS